MTNYSNDDLDTFLRNVKKGSNPVSFADEFSKMMQDQKRSLDPMNLKGPKGDVDAQKLTRQAERQIGEIAGNFWRQKNDTKARHRNVVKQKIPDLMGYTKYGVAIYAEVKARNDSFRDGQIEFLQNAHDNGCICYVIRRYQDIDALERLIRTHYIERNEISRHRDKEQSSDS